jgi:peptidoglycan hydrolase CwlO-like protein
MSLDLEGKVKEISKQIETLKGEIDSATVKVKLLSKSLKEYTKLIEKAKALENGKN